MGLLVSQTKSALGVGAVASAQAAAVRANETRSREARARIRRDMKTSTVRLGACVGNAPNMGLEALGV